MYHARATINKKLMIKHHRNKKYEHDENLFSLVFNTFSWKEKKNDIKTMEKWTQQNKNNNTSISSSAFSHQNTMYRIGNYTYRMYSIHTYIQAIIQAS